MILALTFRTIMVIINVVAVVVIVAIIGYKVFSVRRVPKEKSPQNLTPFLDDETLEGKHLERVLRWALLFSTIVAVVLPIYWVLEPGRQTAEAQGFEDRAVERGATLFANAEMPAYDPTKSLLCADCHGTDAGGGSASYTITPDALGNLKARPIAVTWKAPALNTVMYRFNDCTDEDVTNKSPNCLRAEQQVTQIITYGRPGTPMPAWGVLGGGPKNDQAISDLVAYLKSIQLSPAKAKAQVLANVAALKAQAKSAVSDARDNLATAQAALGKAETPKGREAAQITITAAEQAIVNSQAFETQVANASQGELLFDVNCARCHTKGWSYNDPSKPSVPPPAPAGSGAFGPSLRNGAVLEQFPGLPTDDTKTPGFQSQYDWVANGVPEFKGYGVRGISSGSMAHFGNILSKEQIDSIIEYERNL
ncbi:MAG TPA: c-type cytochrome [Acidimicrobiia bacterium]